MKTFVEEQFVSGSSNKISSNAWKLVVLILAIAVGAAVYFHIANLEKESIAIRKHIYSIEGKLTAEKRVPRFLSGILGPDFHTPLDETVFLELRLDGKQVADADLEKCGHLADLKILGLVETSVTNTGMQYLAGMTKLEGLRLDYTKVNDLSVLKNMPKLTSLSLRHTSVRDEDLEVVEHLSNLTYVGMGYCKIQQVGIAHLAKIPQLTSLSVEGLELSDEDMKLLHGFTNLELIDMENTVVSDAALDELKKALPKLKIGGR